MSSNIFRTGAEWFLRLALAAAFLSAVADRFGFWGPSGASGVAWGDWASFQSYADILNGWAPAALRPGMAMAATGAEIVLGIGLLVPYRTRYTALFSGLLLLVFAVSMTVALGPKAPLDYSVWVGAAAAFLLATTVRD